MSNEVGFAVVGLGMGRGRAQMVRDTEGAQLVKVVDLRSELAREVGEELQCAWADSLDEALNDDDVDVVLVMTPSGLHGDVAIKVLEAGKHAVTTKPMEVTVEKCDAMVEAASKAGKFLAVDFQERYTDLAQKTKYAIDQGLFGKPILCESRLKWFRTQAYYDAGGWRGTWAMDGGGALANQSIHVIDLLVWFLGAPKQVIGRMGTFTHKIETEDLGMAIIEFQGGAMGSIVGTTTYPQGIFWGVEVHGSEGGVSANLNPDGEVAWSFLEGMETREDSLQRVAPVQNIVEDVVSAVRDGTPLVCDGQQGRRSVAVLNAIYASARANGRPVEFDG